MPKAFYCLTELDQLPTDTRLGVIGNPIAHSKSPAMQQAALDSAGLPHRYVRLLSETEEGKLGELVAACDEKGFIGLNVTVPFKGEAFALAVKRDTLSTICGASNTLVKREDGWHAYNTDGPGFQRAIEEHCGKPLASLSVVILGCCGGAGRALAAQCALAGCPALTLVNRARPELLELQKLLQQHAPDCQIKTLHFDSTELKENTAQAQLIVNATSLGLHASDPLPLPLDTILPQHFVYDIVPHDTALCQAAASKKALSSTGEQMLLWQGAIAFEHWFNQAPDIEAMKAALGF